MQKEGRKKTKWGRSAAAAVVVVILLGVLFAAIRTQVDTKRLVIDGHELHVNIATTSQDQHRGLCCRDSLPADEGMLFVYDTPGYYAFWMKDTRIPLDMFWIDSDKRIVYIEKNVQPSSFPKSYVSSQPAQYVLETNAGYANEYHISNRDKVAF